MNCKNCGNLLQPGVTVCPNCNAPVDYTQMNNMQQPMGAPMYNTQPVTQQPKKKSHIVLWIVLGIIGLLIVLVIIGFVSTKKVKCTGSNGSVTVYYYENEIIGCIATGNAYCDLDKLKENAKTNGIDKTIQTIKEEMQKSNYTCTD